MVDHLERKLHGVRKLTPRIRFRVGMPTDFLVELKGYKCLDYAVGLSTHDPLLQVYVMQRAELLMIVEFWQRWQEFCLTSLCPNSTQSQTAQFDVFCLELEYRIRLELLPVLKARELLKAHERKTAHNAL